jgi:alpha-beta hydrolase superfamily lysophospholipase
MAMDNLALGLSAVRVGVTLPPRATLPLPDGLVEREVSLGPENDASRGSLLLPASVRALPAIVLIAGSGPVDRDGNAGPVRNGVLRELAYRLGQAGFATARFDKRGAGRSDAAAVPRGFGGLVADAKAWVEYLQQRPEVASSCVFVLGHSEGGYVSADVAVAKPDLAGLILFASPASELAELLLLQLPLVMRAHGATPSEVDEALELQRNVLRVLGGGDSERLTRWGLSGEMSLWLSQHLERSAAATWRRVRAPVLALFGSDDLQVPPSEAKKLLAALSAPAEIAILEGVDHLMLPLQFRPGLGAYADPDRRLSPRVIERISRWLDARPCVERARGGLAP